MENRTESINTSQEFHQILPIKLVEDKKSFKDVENIDSILKYIHFHEEDKSNLEYHLMTKIKGINYFLNLEEMTNRFFLSFSTDYQFARVNLGEDDRQKLFQTINLFLESIYSESQGVINQIEAITSDVGYSVEEVDTCIDSILESEPAYSKEDLLKLGPSKIFSIYEELYKNKFEYTKSSTKYSDLRNKFFVANLKKHLKNWNIEERGDEIEKEILLIRK